MKEYIPAILVAVFAVLATAAVMHFAPRFQPAPHEHDLRCPAINRHVYCRYCRHCLVVGHENDPRDRIRPGSTGDVQ